MKRILVITFAVLWAHQIVAAEGINSRVIHDYTEFGVAYTYVDDLGGSHGHGVLGHSSVDMNNFLFEVDGGYVWGDDVDLWNLGGGVGYVVRLMRNHINIIPRVGVAYNKALFEDDGSDDFWTLAPGITASFAINNRVSVSGNYAWVHDIHLDRGKGVHTFGPGARVALTERMGLDVGAAFGTHGQAFKGAFAGVSWHF
jgi:hypothetical protein